MKEFMDEKFLLHNRTGEELYYTYASKMPIYDYHCHLDVCEISENKKFRNMHELWLGHDHYKWRAMRWNGIKEEYITGKAEEYEKFMAWAKTMPYCMGNPLYHWSHLELRRYFNIYDILNEKTGPHIWKRCNELLQSDDFTARRLIERSNVKVICTTDDPVDDLVYHKKLREDKEFNVKVLPTFRPDKAFSTNSNDAVQWIDKLSKAGNMKIESFEEFLKAIKERIYYFHNEGCRISDHSIEEFVYIKASINELNSIFNRLMNGDDLDSIEANKYRTAVHTFLGREYSKLAWTMQLHIGAVRNSNSRMFRRLGKDSGFDSMGNNMIASITKLLDTLDEENNLPKTILYSLNPKDYETLGVIAGTFQGEDIPGKIQLGAPWWFNDHKDGITKQLKTLSNLGLLRRFVGMLTDSRSFISYTRHEYFRRILCSFIGEMAEQGEVPNDMDLLGNMIMEICYYNAHNYFGINL